MGLRVGRSGQGRVRAVNSPGSVPRSGTPSTALERHDPTEGWCRHTQGFRTNLWSQNAKQLSQADKQVTSAGS